MATTKTNNTSSSPTNGGLSFAQQRFVSKLAPGARVLDFGCGFGHDAKTFLDAGFEVTAIDSSAEHCHIASLLTGLPVRHEPLLNLSDVDAYDGIWACSSLLHLTRPEIALALNKMAVALRPDGFIFTSFSYGTFEGMRGGSYFTDFTLSSFIVFMADSPSLRIEEAWESRDAHSKGDNGRQLTFMLQKA